METAIKAINDAERFITQLLTQHHILLNENTALKEQIRKLVEDKMNAQPEQAARFG